jgi:hypothetical protein
MKKAIFVLLCGLLLTLSAQSQDLNWNTSGYTTGNLTHNFGTIGSPASTVNMTISGNTGAINGGFPILYAANWPGAGSCAVNCALRTSVTFTTIPETAVYTFSFSPAVSALSFTVYDIDGNPGGTTIDQLTVNATNGVTPQNITMTDIDGVTTVVGSGGTSPVATANGPGSTDNRVNVAIGGFVSSLVVTYGSGPTTTAFGAKSFSIGDMDWTGVLPVKWISFSGKSLNNGTTDLKWVVEDGSSTEYYTVEKSKNGQAYSAIGQVASANAGRNTYSFTDINPGSGNSFYRIRQTEKTGQYEFSNIVLIKEGKRNDPAFTVFPNPANDYIIINAVHNAQISKVQVYDANGRILYQSQNGKNRVETASLKPGVYYIRIEDASGEIYSSSFLKQ